VGADPKRALVRFRLNGKPIRARAYPLTRLLDVLREECGLTGTKEGCGEGECGACSVLVDGELVNSCLFPVVQAEGRRIETVEGLRRGKKLHPVQESFLRHGGAQCGACTPGMVMAAVSLLREKPKPSRAEIREYLSGNLCRCTGYVKILDSVARAGEAES